MKHLLTYNESVRDFLRPKSREELRAVIDGLLPGEKLKKGMEFGVLTRREARDMIDRLSPEFRLQKGVMYGILSPRESYELFLTLPLRDKVWVMCTTNFRYPGDKLLPEFKSLTSDEKRRMIDYGYSNGLLGTQWTDNDYMSDSKLTTGFEKMMKRLKKVTGKRIKKDRRFGGPVFLTEGVRDKMAPLPIGEVKRKIRENPVMYLKQYKSFLTKEEIMDIVDGMKPGEKLRAVLFLVPEYFEDSVKRSLLDEIPDRIKSDYVLGEFRYLYTDEELEKVWKMVIHDCFDEAYDNGKADINLDWFGKRWTKYTKEFMVNDDLYKYKGKFMKIESVESGNWYQHYLVVVGNSEE